MKWPVLLPFAAVLAAQTYDSYVTGSEGDVQPKTAAGLMLSGGGGDVEEAFQWLIRKSGGGDIVILRASGSDGYNKFISGLGTVDSVQSIVMKQPEASRDPKVIETIRKAEAVFLAGGDQWNYVRLWKGTPVEDAIHEVYRKGRPVGGSSAGLAVLGQYSFSAQKDTVTSAQALANPFDERVTIESDFLIFPPLRDVITDSHFSRRDRMGRLLVFLARIGPAGRGIGVDEATAVLVEPDGSATVAGKGAAYFVRPVGKPGTCKPGAPLDAATYSVYKLPANGGSFDLRRWSGSGGTEYGLTVGQGQVRSSQPRASLY